MNFFKTQNMKGIHWIRQKDLKEEARKQGMSPTTLHKLLKEVLSWYISRVKNPEGLYGIFYGLAPKLQDRFIEENSILHKRVTAIFEMSEAEKKENLQSLIGVTIIKFREFVPLIVNHALKNEKEAIEDLQEWLTGCFEWGLLPYLFETIRACFIEKEIALKIIDGR